MRCDWSCCFFLLLLTLSLLSIDLEATCDCGYQEYYIIAGLVGGVLLVTMVILCIVITCGKLRYEWRKRLQGEVVKYCVVFSILYVTTIVWLAIKINVNVIYYSHNTGIKLK